MGSFALILPITCDMRDDDRKTWQDVKTVKTFKTFHDKEEEERKVKQALQYFFLAVDLAFVIIV